MSVLSFFFPTRCAFCGKVIGRNEIFCSSCASSAPVIPDNTCRICGIEKSLCQCRKRSFPCQRRTAPFYYEGEARHGIIRFKKGGHFGGYRVLASLVAEKVKAEYDDVSFDLVVCVPSSSRSVKERGFNQTVLLAREVAESLQLPFDPDFLVKCYDIKPQKGMSRLSRIGNVAGVYDLRDPDAAAGKNFLIVDDVITTGATVNECARMLRIFGAERVYAAAVCLDKPIKKEKNSK